MFITTSVFSLIYGGALEASGKDAKLPEDLTNGSRSTPSLTLSSPEKKEEKADQNKGGSRTKPFHIPYERRVFVPYLNANVVELTQKTILITAYLKQDGVLFDYNLPAYMPFEIAEVVTGLDSNELSKMLDYDPYVISKCEFGCVSLSDSTGQIKGVEKPLIGRDKLVDEVDAFKKSLARELLKTNSDSSLLSSSTSSSSSSSNACSSSSSASPSSAPVPVSSSSSSFRPLQSSPLDKKESSLSSDSLSSSVSVSTSSSLLSPKAVLADVATAYITLSYIEEQVKAMGGTVEVEYGKEKFFRKNVTVNGHTQTFHYPKNTAQSKTLKEQFISFLKGIGE